MLKERSEILTAFGLNEQVSSRAASADPLQLAGVATCNVSTTVPRCQRDGCCAMKYCRRYTKAECPDPTQLQHSRLGNARDFGDVQV